METQNPKLKDHALKQYTNTKGILRKLIYYKIQCSVMGSTRT